LEFRISWAQLLQMTRVRRKDSYSPLGGRLKPDPPA
jgi:hypothetical protein